MLYLAGLDASSPRSPSVLILLVLADLDGSISYRGYHFLAVKSRLTGSPENVIYCVGISPIGVPALQPTGTSVSTMSLYD